MSTDRKRRIAQPGEVYAYYIDCLGKYGACQIIAVNADGICCVALDHLEDEPPRTEQIESLRPYYSEAFRNHHQIVKEWISNDPVPQDYRFIGQCGLKTDEKCNCYAGRWPDGRDYYYEERWKAYDESARAAYKKYMNSGEFVTVHGKMFKKNTDWLGDELYQCLTEKDPLREFPCITLAKVQGYSEKLRKWLCETPLLRTLRLEKAGVDEMDLGGTFLEDLELDMSGIRKLILPETVRSLKMQGEVCPDLQIDDSLCAGKIELDISLKKAEPLRYGLQNLKIRRLRLREIAELDMAQVAEQFPETEYLLLFGRPGSVAQMQAVGKMRGLRSLCCRDLFGYAVKDVEVLQELSELRQLDLDSVPQEVGQYLKKRWKDQLDRLSVTHLRKDEWMKENLDDPFRHWDGNEFIPQAAYKSVRKCYRDTKKKLLAAADRGQMEEIARQYTLCFNKLNSRYEEFIETEEREDIFAAMQQLYEECVLHGAWRESNEETVPLTLEELWNIMEDVREDW